MPYEDIAQKKLQSLKDGFILLSIESSCDETAAAILDSSRNVRSMAVHTQIPTHKLYGGVVPELASRSHVERIGEVVREAIEKAGITRFDIDAIAVTNRPGLIGALLVGVSYAKGLAYGLNLPLVGVDHLSGHIAANYLSHKELEPPFVCLVASGGHSHILKVEDCNRTVLLGHTRDDAAGEAFDKVARVLGLPYPGGPALEALAREGNPDAFSLHSEFNEGDNPDFSFSGLKTAVINLKHKADLKNELISSADLAASFQKAVVKTLVNKSMLCLEQTGLDKLVLAGGVSANMALREALANAARKHKAEFFCPEMKYCTDNAAMIGCAGYRLLLDGFRDTLSLDGIANFGEYSEHKQNQGG